MSTCVLLNLLNKFGNRDEMRGFVAFYRFFPNERGKFNNIRAQM